MDFQKNRARREKYKADMVEIEADLLKKRIVLVEQIQQELEMIFVNFRAKMLSLPKVIASQGLGMSIHKELEDLVEAKIHEALEELSVYEP